MNLTDRKKPITAEDIIRRYNLELIKKNNTAIKTLNNGLTRVDTDLQDFTNATIESLQELQDQVDGNIFTWFLNGVPTLDNSPANEWTTEKEKNNHLGDLYYDGNTGYAYRFSLSETVYSWIKITDTDVVEALAIANSAKDTADSKRRVFVSEPTPPYDVGDIWVGDIQSELMRCRSSRSEGNFNPADWIAATKYTDDTVALSTKAVLNEFKTEVRTGYVTNATLETTTESITGMVESTTTIATTAQETANQNSIDINNNYQNLNDKYNNTAPKETVEELRRTTFFNQTANDYRIGLINETLENGVPKVKTEKGFLFNDSGLTIDETNSKVKNILDTIGMLILGKTGALSEEIMFAGYDEELKESIVRVMNLLVTKMNYNNEWLVETGEHEILGRGLLFYNIGGDS